MQIRKAASWLAALSFAVAVTPVAARAVELVPGDVVLYSTGWTCGIYRLDPVTLAPTQISNCLGFSGGAHHLTVDRHGRLFVIDEVRGVVEVSPATGERSIHRVVPTSMHPPGNRKLSMNGSPGLGADLRTGVNDVRRSADHRHAGRLRSV